MLMFHTVFVVFSVLSVCCGVGVHQDDLTLSWVPDAQSVSKLDCTAREKMNIPDSHCSFPPEQSSLQPFWKQCLTINDTRHLLSLRS